MYRPLFVKAGVPEPKPPRVQSWVDRFFERIESYLYVDKPIPKEVILHPVQYLELLEHVNLKYDIWFPVPSTWFVLWTVCGRLTIHLDWYVKEGSFGL